EPAQTLEAALNLREFPAQLRLFVRQGRPASPQAHVDLLDKLLDRLLAVELLPEELCDPPLGKGSAHVEVIGADPVPAAPVARAAIPLITALPAPGPNCQRSSTLTADQQP